MKKFVSIVLSFIMVAMLFPLNVWATESQNIDFGVVEPKHIDDDEEIEESEQPEISQLDKNENSWIKNYSIPEEDPSEKDFVYAEHSETICGDAITLNNAVPVSDNIIASGYCGGEGDGTNLAWVLTNDGTLTISGEGPMADFGNDETITTAPWGEYSDNLKTLVIEEGVTSIGQYAFYKCYGFEGDIIIPDSVTVIGKLAFAHCSGFNGNLIISKNVTSMGISAFYGCSNLTGNLVLPEKLTEIGYCAFYKCSGLSGNLVIPDSVTTIGQSAFRECSGFTGSLTIGENIKTIGDMAFLSCTGFDGNLYIGTNVISIGNNAFAECSGFIGNLLIPDSVTTIGVAAFYNCSGFNGNLVISKNIPFIRTHAFAFCSGITGDLVVPYSVGAIDEFAFYGCGIINYYFEGNAPEVVCVDAEWPSFDYDDKIYYPSGNDSWIIENGEWNGYTAVPYDYDYEPEVLSGYCGGESDGTNLSWTFSGGTLTISGTGKMADFNISDGADLSTAVSDAPWSGFSNKITKVVFEDEVTTIGNDAFINCKNIFRIDLSENLIQIGVDAFYGCENLSGEIILPDHVTVIDSMAFWGTGITGLTLGEKVEEIGFFAFGNCEKLESVYFNKALTTIGNWAFSYCKNIKNNIIFHENVESIGKSAFTDCSKIKAFYFKGDAPSVSVAENEQPTFNTDANLYYPFDNTTWEVVDGKWNGYNAASFDSIIVASGYCGGEGDGTNLTWSLTEDRTLTISGKGAMADYGYIENNIRYFKQKPWLDYCNDIKALVFEEGITKIGFGAFHDMQFPNIDCNLVIPDSVEIIDEEAFSDSFVSNGSLVLGNGVTVIGDDAFYDCSGLTGNLIIPDNVTTIGKYAFYGCEFDGTINIGNKVVEIGDYAFCHCEKLKGDLIIPNSVESIGSDAFSYMFSLNGKLIIGENVEIIGDDAFTDGRVDLTDDKKGLNGKVIIPDSVTIIGESAFRCLEDITEIKIGENVTYIGDFAFDSCHNITGNLNIPNKVETIGQHSFSRCGFNGNLTLGENLISIGDRAFYRSLDFTGDLIIPDSVKNIGEEAFINCNFTGDLIIGDNVESIGTAAFAYCYGFSGKLELGNNIKIIGDHAFDQCGFNSKLVLPDSLETIGVAAFQNCNKFYGDLIIPENIKTIGCDAFNQCSGFDGNLTILGDIEIIEDRTFMNCWGFNKIDISSAVKNVKGSAFYQVGIKSEEFEGAFFRGAAPVVVSADASNRSFNTDTILYYVVNSPNWTSPMWNGYHTALWNPYIGGALSSGEEGFYIKDAILGIPVDNAQLYYDDKVLSSDSKGFIPFSGEISDFEITGHAYTTRTFEDFKRSSTGIDVITLTPNTEAISKAELNYNGTKYDLLSEHKTLNTKKKDTSITITCEAPSEKVAGYALYQRIDDHGIDIRAESTGTFKLKLDDFIPGYDVYIMTYDSNHKKLAETRIGLNVVYEESFAPSSVKLGKDITFTIAEDIPLVGGNEMKISMPLLPCTFELTDDKIKFGVNFDIAEWEKNSNGKTTKKLFGGLKDADLAKAIDDFCKDVNSYPTKTVESPIVDMNLKVVGYAEGNLDGSCIEGSLYLKFDISGGTEFPFAVGPVPLVMEIRLTGELGAGGELKLTPTSFEYYIDAEAAAKLELYLGVGVKGLSAGVYGNGKISFKFLFAGSGAAESGLYEITLEAKVGVKAKLLGRDLGRLDLISGGPWELYSRDIEYDDKPDDSGNGGGGRMVWNSAPTLNSGKAKSFNDEVMSLLVSDKVYPTIDLTRYHTAEVLYSNGNGNASDLLKYVEKDTYIGINQKIVSAGNTLMAVYTDADLSRNPEDASILVYSVYNEQADSWSSPVAINDDGTADFSPEVYSDGEDIYVVWQDAESKIAENLTLNEIGAATALSAAKFDTDTNEWMILGTIQNNNNSYEAQPQIAVNSGIITVAWVSNSENDVFGLNGTNSVCYSVYNGENWSGATTVKETNSPVTKLSAGTLDGVLTIAYSIDADGDLVGFDDTISYAYSQNSGETKEIGQGATDVKFSSVYGEENMVWCENSSIYSISSINGEKVKITSNADIIDGSFIVCGTENSGAIIYSCYSDGSTNVNAVLYDSVANGWGMPVQLTDQTGYMENIDAVYHNGNLFVSGVQRFVDMTEDYTERCNLFYIEREYSGQATITRAEHKNEDEIIPGGETTITASVANKGTAFVENALFKIENSNAEILFDETITVNLKPGETKEVELKFRLPDEAKKDTYTVSCGNSSRDVVIGFAKINLHVSEYVVADKNYLSLKVENTGFEEIGGAVAINDYVDDSINYFSDDFDKIGYGENITAIFEISPNLFSDGDTLPVCIKVNPEGEINPYSEIWNNINLYRRKPESSVESIEVNTENAKLTYSVEDLELDTTGVVVTAHYSDGTVRDISDICIFSGYNNTVGNKTINVAYKEGNIVIAETTYQIYVRDGNIYGDVNGDGKVNVLDANFVRRYAAKLVEFEEKQLAAADVDGNGKVNVLDANLIRRYSAKLINKFPVEG